MKTLSKNTKLNNCLNGIYQQMLNISDSEEESIKEIKRYKKEFRQAIDFELVSYGNLLIYFDEIRNFYISCGYSAKKWSDEKVFNIYMRQVGYIARNLF